MSTNNIIATDLQSTEVDSGLIDLFELYLNTGEPPICFHPGLDNNLNEIKFYALNDPYTINTYYPLPIALKGVEYRSEGAANRPQLIVANAEPAFQFALSNNSTYFSFEKLIGKTIVIRQTLEKYLVNGTTPNNIEFPIKKFIIDRIAAESPTQVAFELAAAYDIAGIQIPNRTIIGKFCSWVYQGKAEKNIQGCPWRTDNKISYDSGEYEILLNINDEPLINKSVFNSLATTWTSTLSYGIDTLVIFESRYWRSKVDNNLNNPPGSTLFWTEVRLWDDWKKLNQQTISVITSQNLLAGETLIQVTDSTGIQVGMTIWNATSVFGNVIDVPNSSSFVLSGGVIPEVLPIGSTIQLIAFANLPSYTVNTADPRRSDLVKHNNKIWRALVTHTFDEQKEPNSSSTYWKRVDYCGKTLQSCKSRFQATINTGIPSERKNSSIQLPFGAFPGSVKFK